MIQIHQTSPKTIIATTIKPQQKQIMIHHDHETTSDPQDSSDSKDKDTNRHRREQTNTLKVNANNRTSIWNYWGST